MLWRGPAFVRTYLSGFIIKIVIVEPTEYLPGTRPCARHLEKQDSFTLLSKVTQAASCSPFYQKRIVKHREADWLAHTQSWWVVRAQFAPGPAELQARNRSDSTAELRLPITSEVYSGFLSSLFEGRFFKTWWLLIFKILFIFTMSYYSFILKSRKGDKSTYITVLHFYFHNRKAVR